MKLVLAAAILLSASSKSVEGKIVTYSAAANTAILDVGRDHGVVTGMKFTAYRGDEFVATLVVKDVAQDWCVATIELKCLEPQQDDRVSNQVLSPR